MDELEIIFLFGFYFSIGSIRIIHNFLNFDRWENFERENEAESRFGDMLFYGEITKQNPKLIKGYIQSSLQQKYSKRDFAIWGIEVLFAGPLNLLSLPNRW